MRARFAAFIAAAAVVVCGGAAHADPIRTWGSSQAPPATQGGAATSAGGASTPPPPPPATIGTPIEPVDAVPPTPASSAGDTEAVVRSPGHVGLRYVLEGIEVRGNTATLARVVLR